MTSACQSHLNFQRGKQPIPKKVIFYKSDPANMEELRYCHPFLINI